MIIKIETDVYFIAQRLRGIDNNYFVVYNTKTKKYEIHYSGQIGGSFCLSLPYDVLDERAIEMVYKTKIENAKKLFNEIEKDNQLKIKKQQNQTVENFKTLLKEGVL